MASQTTAPPQKASEEAAPVDSKHDQEDDTRIVFLSWDAALVPE